MQQIKHYKIIEKIGSGGMGEVYKALDTSLEREVAIKLLHPSMSNDTVHAERLVREAKAAAKLIHPNVVTIYEVGEDEKGRYIVMEYVQGQSLAELIHKEGPFDPNRAVNITIQILRAMELAHDIGILHRDIKSENILLTENDQAKILDFGIAKITETAGLTVSGEIMGTVEFMPPEQMLGEDVDQRSDLYAIGTILYQLLTKELPFIGQNPVEILFKKLNEEPLPPSQYNKKVFPLLNQIVLKSLQHDMKDRYDSAKEMINALEETINAPQTTTDKPWFDENEDFIGYDDDEFSKTEYLRTVFVGRQKEFKTLLGKFHQINTRGGQTVVLSGEAGVGKSTIATQLKKYVEHQKSWVLYGTCLYQEGMDAYLPYIDALRGFFSRDNSKLSELQRSDLKNIVREKVPILSEFTERFSTTFISRTGSLVDKKADSNINLFESIYLLISILSEIRPVVLVIDDLQWADGASLKLFHYLAKHIVRNPVMLLGISRTDRYDLQEDGKPKSIIDILARMRREDIITEITLKRFTREDCDALVDESLTKTAFSEEFYEGMYSETKGNPFFVIETLKLLSNKNEIYEENGIWLDKKIDFKAEVPNRVEDIFIHRLSTLTEDDREIMQIAAIIGYKFDSSVISHIIEINRFELLKKLHKIERDLHIISSSDQLFQFEHPMLADLLYAEVPQALTMEYHLIIAQELEKIHGKELGALVGDVAQHFRRSGDHISAIPLLYQAGVRAFDISAYREAGLFFEDLLDSVNISKQPIPESIPKIDLFFKCGVCHEECGNLEKSLDAFKDLVEASSEQNNISRKIEAMMRIGRIYDKLGEWSISMEYYEECLSLARDHDVKNIFSRVYNKIGIYYFHKGDYDNALKYLKKTIRTADSDRGELDKAHAYSNIGIIANIVRGEYGLAMENFEKALIIYEKLDKKHDQASVYHNIGMFYSDQSQWLESIKAYEKCLKLCDDEESKHLRALTFLNMGKAYARQKKLVKAKNFTDKSIKIFKRMADIISLAEAYQVYGIIYNARGDFAKSEEYLKDALNIFTSKGFQEGVAQSYETFGLICQENGKTDQALEYYDNAIETYKKIKIDAKVDSISQIVASLEDEYQTDHVKLNNQ